MIRRYLWLALLLSPSVAAAYGDPAQFINPPGLAHAAMLSDSSEGIYFTGAPRFSYLTCQSCHIDGPNTVAIKLGADVAELFTDGYEPGRTYSLEVELLNETLGLSYNSATCTEAPGPNDHYSYVPCNNNGFALEVNDASGTPLRGPGALCAGPPVQGQCPPVDEVNDEVMVSPNLDAVFINRAHSTTNPEVVLRNGATSWHLWWTAPKAGTGAVTFYLAAVDGDGGTGRADTDQDPLNDDTVQAAISILEQGAPPPPSATGGCATTRARRISSFTPLFVLLGVAAIAYRKRRRRPG